MTNPTSDVRRAALVRRASTFVMVAAGVGAVALGVSAFREANAQKPVTEIIPAVASGPLSTPGTLPPDMALPTVPDEWTATTIAPAGSAPVSGPSSNDVDDPIPPPPTTAAPVDDSTGDAAPVAAPSGATSPTTPAPTTIATTTTTTVPAPALPTMIRSSRVNFGDLPVIPVGTEPDGALEVPGAFEIGWYERGGMPYGPGATVLAAHVTWNGDLGAFYELGRSELGDLIGVTLEDGRTRAYVVTEIALYGKYELPEDRIWRDEGAEELVLITCGGEFDDSINRYKHNIVVYATPID